MNNGSDFGHFWRGFGILEMSVLTKSPRVAGTGALVDDFILASSRQFHLTQSVFKVILKKSTPPEICQLVPHYTNTRKTLTDLCGN